MENQVKNVFLTVDGVNNVMEIMDSLQKVVQEHLLKCQKKKLQVFMQLTTIVLSFKGKLPLVYKKN